MPAPVGRPTAIYALSGADGLIRYIGKAIDPKRRLKAHISVALVGQSNKDRWLRKQNEAGTLKIEVLEWTNDWRAREKHWIAFGRSNGWPLLNIAEGGDDHKPLHTPIASAKRSASPYRKVIVNLVQVAVEARKDGNQASYDNLMSLVRQLRSTARYLKGKFGEADFQLWANWLYRQFPGIAR